MSVWRDRAVGELHGPGAPGGGLARARSKLPTRRSRATVAILLAVGVTGACVPWSDPAGPPIGMRMDGGVIRVLVPDCARWRPVSAEITPDSASTFPPPVWSASGFLGSTTVPIELGPASWQSTQGSYSGLSTFSIDIQTQTITLGAGLWSTDEVSHLRNLPSGQFWDGSKQVTAQQYRQEVAKDFPCRATSSPTA